MTATPHIDDHQERILIVDDGRENRELLAVILSAAGFLTVLAGSGEEALVSVAEQPPDLILLDLMMPDMNGYEITAKLKANVATQHIPVIMVTAAHDHKARMLARIAGAEGFMTKPLDCAALLVQMRELLRLKIAGE